MFGQTLLVALVLTCCFYRETAGRRFLHFPEPANRLSWSLLETKTPDLDTFTACAWIKTIRTTSGPILSYGSKRHPRSIEISYSPHGHGYSVILNGMSVLGGYYAGEAPLPADGNWHFLCVMWSGVKRKIDVYRDGFLTLSFPVNVSHIAGGGDWVVGHTHLEAVTEGYPKYPSFVGYVGGINVWNREAVDIPGLFVCANGNEGSIISWNTVTKTNFMVATYAASPC
ncbi:neuronal pentraxin-2-like [Lingula anatina]|uniref:Neuronal pentraxin-2-like n=1 Tax=Lingula anatina TaxID=7574 RepID=A0A1S3I432_LINAN|nr:neuronal pentraxin-2-like [Lingula anatina]|eukprot:XP_013392993.1 neuronal pentraxin-2-like [Lingula anatina]